MRIIAIISILFLAACSHHEMMIKPGSLKPGSIVVIHDNTDQGESE